MQSAHVELRLQSQAPNKLGSAAAMGSLHSDRFTMCGISTVFSVRVIVWFLEPISFG